MPIHSHPKSAHTIAWSDLDQMSIDQLVEFLRSWYNPPPLGPYWQALRQKTAQPGRRTNVGTPCFLEVVKRISAKHIRTMQRWMRKAGDATLPSKNGTVGPELTVGRAGGRTGKKLSSSRSAPAASFECESVMAVEAATGFKPVPQQKVAFSPLLDVPALPNLTVTDKEKCFAVLAPVSSKARD